MDDVVSLVEEARKSSEAQLRSKQPFEVALDHEATQRDEDWKATTQIKMTLVCLAIVSLAVALDATILVTALPVSQAILSNTFCPIQRKLTYRV